VFGLSFLGAWTRESGLSASDLVADTQFLCDFGFMKWRLHLIAWLGLSVVRTIQITWVFWALLAVAAYFDWGGQKGWTEFLVPLSWLTLLALAVMLAIRKHELSNDLD
jgi:hypothetical protein